MNIGELVIINWWAGKERGTVLKVSKRYRGTGGPMVLVEFLAKKGRIPARRWFGHDEVEQIHCSFGQQWPAPNGFCNVCSYLRQFKSFLTSGYVCTRGCKSIV